MSRDNRSPSVQLAAPRAEHAALWARWRTQSAAQRYTPLAPTPVEKLAERLVQGSAPLCDHAATEHRRMILCGDVLVGTVALTHPSWSMGYGELGYQIDEAWQGRGVGTQGVRAFVGMVLRETRLRRLTGIVSVENMASVRLLERIGFRREGLLRAHYVIGGFPVDHYAYGLLREEWSEPP